jgi:ketosteroid isomerase-like protein
VNHTATDIVRAYFDAWNRRDLEALEAVLDPEVEWERSADFPEGRTLHGRESLVDFARSMFDVFAETPVELAECVEPVPGRVVVEGTSGFRGGRSGAETTARWVRLYSVESGAIVAVRPFSDRGEAMNAASDEAGRSR